MVVECPNCEAEVQIERGVETARCEECLSEFQPPGRRTVVCPGCNGELAVPPGAGVVLCGTCHERVDVATGRPAPPPSTHAHIEVAEQDSTTANEETSVIGGPEPYDEARLQNVQAEFADRYEVLEPIGKGGMGAVFKARQRQPERLVVLKVMLSGRFASSKYRRRFEREAQAVARLKHPGIVSVYEYGEVNDQPYFTMEYVEGCSVREYVQRHKLDKHEICEIVMKVCRAVAYAHQRGVIHRDIKPSNILVDGQGNPRLLDFGLARLADGHWDEEAEMSESGEVMGTPSYMSPEQTLGRPDEIDLRSDVYSVGVLFYELLTGTLPYRIDRDRPLESLRIVRDYIPKRPSTVNPNLDHDLDSIVMKCLEKERELRYQSAVELAEDVNRYLTDKPVEARPSTSFYHLRKLLWRHRGLFLPVSAAVLIGLVLNVVFVAELMKSERRTRAEYRRMRQKDERILEFVRNLNAVRSTVDTLIMQGRWEEAYDKARFAESHFAGGGYQDYARQVRRRIAAQAEGEFEQIQQLIDRLEFKTARERISQMKELAQHLGLPELENRAEQMSTRFGDLCYRSLKNYIDRNNTSARVLQKFLAEVPGTEHESYIRRVLSSMLEQIHYSDWPFSEQEARRRRRQTARTLDAAERTHMDLGGGADLPLVLIPAGEFVMGAPEGQGPGSPDDGPPHRVRISDPFYVGATEVTCAQFEAVTGRFPSAAGERCRSEPQRMPAPVSWQEAQEFCTKLSRRKRFVVRLPTEAEWEYMCRAGSENPFPEPGGAQEAGLERYAWYGANSGDGPNPVEQKAPNPFGLYDVYGNMLEWCSDWYDSRYYLASPVDDPAGPESGDYKVLRGGSWKSEPSRLGAAVRTAGEPQKAQRTYGFRVVVDRFAGRGGPQEGPALAGALAP
ncbi:MAG: bifunctional serine/threonine-protein kinase/formylglycine-generating enzyme family protein [Planctomycetota bacterium]